MTDIRVESDGRVVAESSRYRLEVAADGLFARLSDGLALRPLAALDTVDAPDETLSVAAPRAEGDTVVVERRSTVWERASVSFVCREEGVDVRTAVAGRGSLADAHLLAGRSLVSGQPIGYLPSGHAARTLFSPNPGDPSRLVRPAGESAAIGVAGDGSPGRGHWIFTPAPLCLCLGTGDDAAGWTSIALAAPVERLTFVELIYRAADLGFALELDYDGHTDVDGGFEAPTVVLRPGAADPYAAIRAHRDDLVERGFAPPPRERDAPSWWSEPIFCGWGAQCYLATQNGAPAPALATQANYDDFLARLEREGLDPGVLTIDDKWSLTYGACEPDPQKWPDLRGWIAEQHARGRRVLLWWKAWDCEGLPAELCIRNADGEAVAFDPSNPAAREALAGVIDGMLSPEGLDADGLKIDFTARTPSGRALAAHGDAWGIALLHDLLATVYAAAKRAKPDALVVTHTPNPAFVDVTDMIRLNDMLRLDDPEPGARIVPQMRQRAEIARAACPELLVDTDDWPVPSLLEWREYLEEKSLLGVPALYYVTNLDSTGERLEPQDYEALRRVWKGWRNR